MEGEYSDLAIRFFSFLRDGLFPNFCLFCQKEGQKICVDCSSFIWETAEPVCPFCHQKTEEGKSCEQCGSKTFLDGCTSLGFYHQPTLRGLIQSWKFNRDLTAEKLLKKFVEEQRPLFLVPPVDWCVTAIPLHEARCRERGFNQAEVIGRVVAQEINSEYVELLDRVEWTDPQAGRSSEERTVGDLDEVFQTTGLVPPCVLLCDDVLTSGATMDAAAKALKEAGAQIVWGFTLARAGS